MWWCWAEVWVWARGLIVHLALNVVLVCILCLLRSWVACQFRRYLKERARGEIDIGRCVAFGARRTAKMRAILLLEDERKRETELGSKPIPRVWDSDTSKIQRKIRRRGYLLFLEYSGYTHRFQYNDERINESISEVKSVDLSSNV